MKAFHDLLTALYRVERADESGPLPPREVLQVWNDPVKPKDTKDLTLWGAFLAAGGLVEGDNPVIWSSVNASHFDRTKQLFRSDQDVRNWFPVCVSDREHVEAVHSVGSDNEARATFLSASYIAEGFERAGQLLYLGCPWLLGTEFSKATPSIVTTIGLENSRKNLRIAVHHPSLGVRYLSDLFIADDLTEAPVRFHNYLTRIGLLNRRDKRRTASYLLRVPAGKTEKGHHLLELFHAFPHQPSNDLIKAVVAVTDIAAAAIQSVLAPTIIQEAERSRLRAFLSDVVAHDIHNWRENVAATVDNIRDVLKSEKVSAAFRQSVDEDLTLVEFDNEVFHRVLSGFSWSPTRKGVAGLSSVELSSLIAWIMRLRHPKLKGFVFSVEVTGTVDDISIPGETNIVVANLIRNAVKANQDETETEIQIAIAIQPSSVTIAVASTKHFNLHEWFSHEHRNGFPDEHRGLWICRQMLRSRGFDLLQHAHPRFGCYLQFSVPVL